MLGVAFPLILMYAFAFVYCCFSETVMELQVVAEKFDLLRRSLNPSIELQVRLRSVAVIKEHLPTIKQQSTLNEKNDVILQSLLEVPEDLQKSVMDAFLAALRSTGQDHVANVFRHESDKVPMSDEHYRLLNANLSHLCQFLEPRYGLVDHLYSEHVFTGSDRESALDSQLSVNEMASQTVEILKRKSDDSFQTFIDALKKTKQDHVVYILTGTGRKPMSEGHRNLLQTKKNQLVKFLDPQNGVLLELVAAKTISGDDEVRINNARKENGMIVELINTLMRKSEDSLEALIKALNATEQDHVTYILTGEGDSRPLSEECRAKLVQKRSTAVSSIRADCLISTLRSNGVFSLYDQDRVKIQQTSDDKAEMILDLIARKSQAAFERFIDTLQQCHHKHVAEELMGSELRNKIAEAIRSEYRQYPDILHQFNEEIKMFEDVFRCDEKLSASRSTGKKNIWWKFVNLLHRSEGEGPNIVEQLGHMTDSVLRKMLDQRQADCYEDGMIGQLNRTLTNNLDALSKRNKQDLDASVKLNIHVWTLQQFCKRMEEMQTGWDKKNKPSSILQENKERYTQMINAGLNVVLRVPQKDK